MSAQSTDPGMTLPTQVLRPLYIGFCAVFLALVGFAFWASLAPLATSIHATGHLNAAKPSFDLQHPFGGEIADMLVAEHDVVSAGQLLLRLDVSNAVDQHAELLATLAPMQAESEVLHAALIGRFPQSGSGAPDLTGDGLLAVKRMQNMHASLSLNADLGQQLVEALLQRADSLQSSLAARQAQRNSMRARHTRYLALVKNGALRAAEGDVLLETILDLEASIQKEQAELASITHQAQQARLQTDQQRLDFRQRLLDRLAQLEEGIPRLRLQILRLSAQIEQAEMRAPDAGVVSKLNYDTAAMYVARGDTVLTLARPTQDHRVSFVASAQSIDQMRVGMRGLLTVTSVSQRTHPRVEVTIKSLSPEARRDAEGTILGYDGVALIDGADRAALQAQMGADVTLATDMPVSLIFTGRQTTFGDYLLGPFLDFLSKALQD